MPSRSPGPFPDSPDDATVTPSPLAPLKHEVFRLLWSVTLVANVCMWMNDVAAAWMMASLDASPAWVALVQTASNLPVFLLGLPSGALADILDRRRFFIFTQFWIAGISLLLCTAVLLDMVTPVLLLALTFANGIGLAMRWPLYAALVPELVPRAELPSALALNAVAMNVSRIAGPLGAGLLIASAGSGYVFMLTGAISVLSGMCLLRWQRNHVVSPLGPEHLGRAIKVGLQFVRHSATMKSVLLRVSLFFFHAITLQALLPLVARGLGDGGANAYTLLLASMGCGAVFTVVLLPRLRTGMSRDRLVMYSTMLQAAMMAVVAHAPNVYVAAPAMFICGMAWISSVNTLTVSAQLALPDWVRARAMSVYQMAIMGAGALGAAFWGQVAAFSSVQSSLLMASVSGALSMAAAWYFMKVNISEEDLRPSHELPVPAVTSPPGDGQVLVTIEYQIDPLRANEFVALMEESRRHRLRQGVLSWNLLHDIARPERYIEQVLDVSWTEYLRRFDRHTGADVTLRDRKLAFHVGDAAPEVTRYVVRIPTV
ncbi:MFS transporter [Noviherbaspirillum sp. Root189]|uniref:MFS transporter n=1 Tax=Noviherbaspirillum sp. Root189 TaxID=1736487 RepID=UPI00070DBE03|nr:MFS transporter [Noviherbaspirillum sp. Root189]KRB70718.1 arabinose ABC transporter permease [Noviherbaspirillum sp. Root189]